MYEHHHVRSSSTTKLIENEEPESTPQRTKTTKYSEFNPNSTNQPTKTYENIILKVLWLHYNN